MPGGEGLHGEVSPARRPRRDGGGRSLSALDGGRVSAGDSARDRERLPWARGAATSCLSPCGARSNRRARGHLARRGPGEVRRGRPGERQQHQRRDHGARAREARLQDGRRRPAVHRVGQGHSRDEQLHVRDRDLARGQALQPTSPADRGPGGRRAARRRYQHPDQGRGLHHSARCRLLPKAQRLPGSAASRLPKRTTRSR